MTFNPRSEPGSGSDFGSFSRSMQSRWRWFVGLGALAAFSGLLALILTVTATIVSVVVIGLLMILTGAVEIALGFRARTWGRALYWELAGLLYVLAGGMAIADPVPASFIITLFIGAGLLATGIVRLVIGFRMKETPARGPLMLAGAVTALLGLIIVLGWPGNSFFVLGTLLGIDLLFTGIGWILFGLRLRSAA